MPTDPMWINADTGAPAYDGAELRRAMATLLVQGVGDKFGARSGVHPGGGNAVQLSGSTVTVLHTKGVVYPGLTATSGPYIVQLPSKNHAVPAADPSNPRKDIVVMRVWDDSEDLSGLRQADTEYLTGTPAASPSEPAVPAGAFRMATIDVPAGGSGTLTYNAPFVVCNGGILPVRNAGERPTAGMYSGFAVWRQDTNELEVWDGSAWMTVASEEIGLRGRVVMYVQRSTSQPVSSDLAGATAEAITFNTEIIDLVDGWVSGPFPENNKFKPQMAGWYMMNGGVSYSGNVNGNVRGCCWRKNGGGSLDGSVVRAVQTTGDWPSGTTVSVGAMSMPVDFNGSTDYLELVALHDAGVELDTGTSGFRPFMTATYLGPL